jgi:hypothetical protein
VGKYCISYRNIDFGLKVCILEGKWKSNITGRNIAWKGARNPMKMTGRVQNPADRYPKDH